MRTTTTTKLDDALARKVMNAGARIYIQQLEGELKELRAFFPDSTEPPTSNGHRTLIPTRAKSTRRKMTAAQRAAIGKRMKAYWKARRRAKRVNG